MLRLEKRNLIKTVFVLCAVMALSLILAACGSGSSSNEQNGVQIKINTPSAGESVIAPGRHFKVSGSLSGQIPDDAVFKEIGRDTSELQSR